MKIRVYLLAVKYWAQGSSWEDAVYWATLILNAFKKLEAKDEAKK